MKKVTEESLEFIISVLVNEKIEAEENNNKGINNEYINSVNKALKELNQVVNS